MNIGAVGFCELYIDTSTCYYYIKGNVIELTIWAIDEMPEGSQEVGYYQVHKKFSFSVTQYNFTHQTVTADKI